MSDNEVPPASGPAEDSGGSFPGGPGSGAISGRPARRPSRAELRQREVDELDSLPSVIARESIKILRSRDLPPSMRVSALQALVSVRDALEQPEAPEGPRLASEEAVEMLRKRLDVIDAVLLKEEELLTLTRRAVIPNVRPEGTL